MPKGYTAFIDVLGFREKVTTTEDGQDLFQDYYQRVDGGTGIPESLGLPEVSYAVFSDSIVLYNKEEGGDGLASMCVACSGLFFRLLELSLPPRGSIAHGSFRNQEKGTSRIVYGQPIMEAVEYETRQDWVGIMLAPSVRRYWKEDRAEDESIISAINNSLDQLTDQSHGGHAVLTEYGKIPLKANQDNPLTFDQTASDYEGCVILPNVCSNFSHSELRHSIEEASRHLRDMESYAPDPASQMKYRRAVDLLSGKKNPQRNTLEDGWK